MFYYFNKDTGELIDSSSKKYGDCLIQLDRLEYDVFRLYNYYTVSEIKFALDKTEKLKKKYAKLRGVA